MNTFCPRRAGRNAENGNNLFLSAEDAENGFTSFLSAEERGERLYVSLVRRGDPLGAMVLVSTLWVEELLGN